MPFFESSCLVLRGGVQPLRPSAKASILTEPKSSQVMKLERYNLLELR
jgi:hypothetical protein